MKKIKNKILLVTWMAWFAFSFAYTQSQPQLTSGIKIAANWSDYAFKNMENIRCSMKTGFSFGGLINIEITENFAFQSELTLNYKVSEIGDKPSNSFVDYQYFSFEIPSYAILKKKMKRGEIYAGAGPYIGAGYAADVLNFNLYDEEVIKPVDFGIAATIGYELPCRMQFYAGYQGGMINLIDVGSSSNVKMKSRSFFVGIAYKFKAAKEEKLTFY